MTASLLRLLACCAALSVGVSASVETKQVTCGSLVKLRHVATNYRLHSHDIPYGQGSRQQSVTAFPRPDDANSYWVVRGTEVCPTRCGELAEPVLLQDAPCRQGAPIGKKQRIRLQHNRTRRWLHSHLHYSPLSQNQEVSAFGDDGVSDTGDVWIVEWDARKSAWDSGMQVRLRHADTDAYLMSHQLRYSNPIRGQQEVSAVQAKDKKTLWETAEGVYFALASAPIKDEL